MAARGLNWTTVQIPFSGSLETKQDVRLSSPPDLDIAKDVHFEQSGGVQTRPPLVTMANAIFGGGTLANCRKFGIVNGELCVFTDVALYSWNAQLSQWVIRGTHLAVNVDETSSFVTTGDQIDSDRAELSGVIVYAWTEGSQVYAAALDKVTGSVLVTPTAVSSAVSRPRLVALATKILLFTLDGSSHIVARSIDPASPGTAIAGAGTNGPASDINAYYDVVRAGTQDLIVGAYRRTTTTAYTAFTCTPGLSFTTSNKARTCDGPIAVSTVPDGTKTQVVRANGTNIQGDLLTTSTLADLFTAQAVGTVAGTAVNQIAAAHRSVQDGGAFRCYVFWHAQESTSTSTWVSKSNWVDTANSLGTEANFVRHLAVASRAFDYAGSIYVWLTFGGSATFNGSGSFFFSSVALQNTYFLYRDDAFLANAKAVPSHGGGFAPSIGRLPGVALTAGSTTYAWCATEKRRFDQGGVDHVGFAARAPVDVVFTFDDNRARRSTQLGRTLYITGGEVLQYDGVRLVECGFHVYPWVFSIIDAAAGGTVAVGIYSYKETYRYQNGVNEIERSTTATTGQVTVTGNSTSLPSPNAPLTATHKTAVPPAVEVWRTQVGAPQGASFYLASSNDPTASSNPNRYLPNDPTAASLPTFTDFLADAVLQLNESNPENDGDLPALAPPQARIVVPTETRLILAGVAGDPDGVWYSRERGDGELASFHGSLRFDVPPEGGDITAVWHDDQFLYVARETALYAFAGPGFGNDRSGQNFTLVRTISRDVGVVSQEAHAPIPMGRLLKSAKGWYVWDGSALRYVGGGIASFDTDTVVSVITTTARHQVRVLTTSRLLLWDYRALIDATDPGIGRWSEWTVAGGLDAVLWNGTYVYLTATGPLQESADYSGLTYGIDVELSWIKLAELQGWGRLRFVEILGEFRSSFLVRIRIARDYQYDGAGNVVYFDDFAWAPQPTTVGSALQVKHPVTQGNCESVKVRITAVTDAARATLVTTALSPQVATSGTAWNATWRAGGTKPGEMGNAITMSLAFEDGTPFSIDVREHFTWNHSVQRWTEDLNNIGVRVLCTTGSSPTVAQLESAISAGTSLALLNAADATPSKIVNAAGMVNLTSTAAFTGGAYGSPTGEACRLSGLALEVGLKQGLYRRLPAAQKV